MKQKEKSAHEYLELNGVGVGGTSHVENPEALKAVR